MLGGNGFGSVSEHRIERSIEVSKHASRDCISRLGSIEHDAVYAIVRCRCGGVVRKQSLLPRHRGKVLSLLKIEGREDDTAL